VLFLFFFFLFPSLLLHLLPPSRSILFFRDFTRRDNASGSKAPDAHDTATSDAQRVPPAFLPASRQHHATSQKDALLARVDTRCLTRFAAAVITPDNMSCVSCRDGAECRQEITDTNMFAEDDYSAFCPVMRLDERAPPPRRLETRPSRYDTMASPR